MVSLSLYLSLSHGAATLYTLMCIVLALKGDEVIEGELMYLIPLLVLTILSVICVVIIWRQPQSNESLNFKVRACVHFIYFNSSHFITVWHHSLRVLLPPDQLVVRILCCDALLWMDFPINLFSPVNPRYPFSPFYHWSVFLSMSTSWCSWMDLPGLVLQCGWQLVSRATPHFSPHNHSVRIYWRLYEEWMKWYNP